MKNLFQKAILGTAMIAGLVGCAGGNQIPEPEKQVEQRPIMIARDNLPIAISRDGLLLTSGMKKVPCEKTYFIDFDEGKRHDFYFGNSGGFYKVGLKVPERKLMSNSQDIFIINSVVVDGEVIDGTGKYRIFKSCIKSADYTKGKA